MTWSTRPDGRKLVISAIHTEGRAFSVSEIAVRIGRSRSNAYSLLNALIADDVVVRSDRYGPGGGKCYRLTGTPMPEEPCQVDHGNYSELSSRFDHRALADALNMPRTPPTVRNARIHILEGGR